MIYANDHAKCHALKFLIARPIPCRRVCLFNIAHYDHFLTPHFVLVFAQSISFCRGVPPSSTTFHVQCSTSFSIHPVSWLCSQPSPVLSPQLLPCWLSRHPMSLNSQEMLRRKWFIGCFVITTSSNYPGREQREIPTMTHVQIFTTHCLRQSPRVRVKSLMIRQWWSRCRRKHRTTNWSVV